MGGAQPLAPTMAAASMLAVEVDQQHIQRRLDTGYCDTIASTLDEALDQIREATHLKQPLSIGLLGNATDIYPELVRRGIKPDMVTDQTSAHDVLNGYIPAGLSLAEAAELRQRDPEGYVERAKESIAKQVRAMLEFYHQGIPVVDYGNNLRQVAYEAGVTNAFDYPGFVPAYIRPLFCWGGLGERARLGLAFNEMVAKGELRAPIVIGRDHLDSGSVASPNRETEAMKDGSDAVSDWPLLNALLNCASGATWVSIHHGGGVGMGFSQHAGMVIVADGTPAAAKRLERVLTNDPASGVMRHADAGYEEAIACAREKGLNLPMVF